MNDRNENVIVVEVPEEDREVESRTALIIDDSSFVRLLLKNSLEAWGVERVAEASDGREALTYLSNTVETVSIIFCDLEMPGLDGIQFIRSLASCDRRPPVVFLSSAPERTLRAAETLARGAGLVVAGLLRKPFEHNNIQCILAALPAPERRKQERAMIEVEPGELAGGISRGEIELYYQPKVHLKSRSLIGVEALARWRHPVHGMLMPDLFIPIVERENLASPFTEAVLTRAVLQCVEWRRRRLSCKVAVNVSPQMLTDSALPDWLMRIVSDAGLIPSDLILEVTESGVFADALLSMEIIARLDLRGFAISIDDYGTGFSSMQQLQRLPFSELKIDRMFITGAAHNSVNQTVIRSSVELARKLNMSVVAEGVETAEDWSLVLASGCDIGQGYFIARPMPADSVQSWVHSWQMRTDIPLHSTDSANAG